MTSRGVKLRIGLMAALLLVGTGIAGIKFVASPSSGSVSVTPPPKQVAETLAINDGTYASFSYPSSFTLTTAATPVPPVVESFSYVRHQIGSWQLEVQFSRIESGSLDDNGSYNFRNKTPSRFLKSSLPAHGQSAIVFTDTSVGSFTKTAYLQHGTMNVSLSVLGNVGASDASLQSVFAATLASFVWK